MTKYDIIQVLERTPELRTKLFARGFYFTNATVNEQDYPFYGLWNKMQIGEFTLLVAQGQTVYTHSAQGKVWALIGHAYDPIDICGQEKKLLERLNEVEWFSDIFWKKFHQWTGVFTLLVVEQGKVWLIGDPAGIQTTFYCKHNEKLHISSHTNCLGDLLDLTWDSYIQELVNYRFFPLLGNSFPGDLTQFSTVRRLVPNHYVCFAKDISVQRFYVPKKVNGTQEEIVEKVATLLQNNLYLIAQKWKNPAISMTGGCDSKTTLACAREKYAEFSYFSYVSSEEEAVDANAAHSICDALGLKHTVYQISDRDEDYINIEAVQKILFWNTGASRKNNKNDVRKRIAFADTQDFSIEVKSWASEIGRAYYSKRFHGRTHFGQKPTPRTCTTLYKFFLFNRKLVRQTDRVFAEYLEKYFVQNDTNPIDWQEQFFWEFRVPSWNGVVITGEHRYSFDITIPYNNRILLEYLLSAPLEDRINDTIYKQIRARMNSEIDATNIAVQNVKHTSKRAVAEDIYYVMNRMIP